MPPKKRTSGLTQTTLSFGPKSSTPKALFTVEAAAPLRSHAAILGQKSVETFPPKIDSPFVEPHSSSQFMPSALTLEEREAADIQLALEMSKNDVDSQEFSLEDRLESSKRPRLTGGSTTPPTFVSNNEVYTNIYERFVEGGFEYEDIPACRPPKRKATSPTSEAQYTPPLIKASARQPSPVLIVDDDDELLPSQVARNGLTRLSLGVTKAHLNNGNQHLYVGSEPVVLSSDDEDDLLSMPAPTPSHLVRNESTLSSQQQKVLNNRQENAILFSTASNKANITDTRQGFNSHRKTPPFSVSSSQSSTKQSGDSPFSFTRSSSVISDDSFSSAASSFDQRISQSQREQEIRAQSSNTLPARDTYKISSVATKSHRKLGLTVFSEQSALARRFSPTTPQHTPSGRTVSGGASYYQPPPPFSSTHGKVTAAFGSTSSQTQVKSNDSTRPQSLYSSTGAPTTAYTVGNGMSGYSNRENSPLPTKNQFGSYTSQKSMAPGIELSEEQQYVLRQVMEYRKNVFFTGSAGTGKSVLMREIIRQLKAKYQNNSDSTYNSWGGSSGGDGSVAVTASTGIAACNIGGSTIHSFAGIGIGNDQLPLMLRNVKRNRGAVQRWMEVKVLIVDEVSMIDGDLFDKLESVARAIRKREDPWGGIQLVITGDFFQLPPVSRDGTAKFAFESVTWTKCGLLTVQLMTVFRQKDPVFAKMLNDMRVGVIASTTANVFRSKTIELDRSDGIAPTELFPLRNQVDEANNRMLKNLQGPSTFFEARDTGPKRDMMEKNCLAPTKLEIKIGAQVMLLKNQGLGGLVNGSLGIVTAMVDKPAENVSTGANASQQRNLNDPGELLPMVRFKDENGRNKDMVIGREEWRVELPSGELQAARLQIPLTLAWSLSIHKSQGQTLSKVKVDLGRVFEKGQAYVALSRATSLDGLQVLNFDPRKVMAHPRVVHFYKDLMVIKDGKLAKQ